MTSTKNASVFDRSGHAVLVATLSALLAGCGSEQPAGSAGVNPPADAKAESVLPPPNPQRNAYFGDLHLHTSMSFDAYTMKTNTLPEDSYRFAQGEPVDYLGQKVQRHAPLDFLAVTDHSEYLGVFRIAGDPKGPFANTDWPKQLHPDDPAAALKLILSKVATGFGGGKPIDEFRTPELVRSGWQRQIDIAEQFNQPGRFTTFVAYEWTSMPNFDNLHRNVIFRGPKYPAQPFTSLDSWHPEDLWAFADRNRGEGIDSVIIPHNSNLSGGLMFDAKDSNGKPIDRDYADARSRNERVVEITQAKGSSDTRPELSPNDEFANFELLKLTSFSGASKPEHYPSEFVRSAYKTGLELQARIGVNPYDFGLIAASDFHTGISATEENNFPGAHGITDSHQNAKMILTDNGAGIGCMPPATLSAGGITGVWAEQNTRDSIFDALKRRETFATSGDRIKVRLFAGWNYPQGVTRQADWLKTAYEGGVPMGSDLLQAQLHGKTPTFLLQSLKDPDSGNLDRIQVIKVWYDHGKTFEKVFDAVWAGDRRPDPKTGKLPAIGNTVDVKTATYTNSIGATELLGEWTDPEFDAKNPATYYARVLEIPTPRWTTYLAVRNGLPLTELAPPTIQERAWTSPVFYQP